MFRHIPGIKATGGGGGYEVGQSVLVDASDAWFTRNVVPATNKFTYSTWIKPAWTDGAAGNHMVMHWQAPGGSVEIKFGSTNLHSSGGLMIRFLGGAGLTLNSIKEYNNYSSWMNLTLVWDPADSVISAYINGLQVEFDSAPDFDLNWGMNAKLALGGYFDGAGGPLKSYMAETHFIDGQALGPEHFALPNEDGDYLPTPYTGTYGNNGFRLEFEDGSNIGADSSGNGNDFTVTGMTPDAIVADSPTNNWCTFNPSTQYSQPGNDVGDLYHGNLGLRGSEASLGGYTYTPGTMNLGQGKWYFEAKVVDIYGSSYLGIHDINNTEWGPAGNNPGNILWSLSNGRLYMPPGPVQYPAAACINGDIAGMAFDMVNETVEFFINGVSQNEPVSWTGLAMPVETYQPLFAPTGMPSGGVGNKPYAGEAVINFGQRPFAYDPPEGYLAINSQNMETVPILDVANSLKMDGTSTSARMGRTLTHSNASLQFTYSAWIKQSSPYGNQLVSWRGKPPDRVHQTGMMTVHPDLQGQGWNGAGTDWTVTNGEVVSTEEWHHYLLNIKQGTGSKIYIDGKETDTVISNIPSYWNHMVGQAFYPVGGTAGPSWNGNTSEVYYIDGEILGPEHFLTTNNVGQIFPREYSGSYTGDSCYLNFSDADNLGKDFSGLGNDQDIVNKITAANQVDDSPTNNLG